MKPIINRSREKINSNKNKNYHRYSSINLGPNNKISNVVVNQELSSIYRTNKTIQKYINEKLNLLKENNQKNTISNGFHKNIDNNLKAKKNLSFNINIRNKTIKAEKSRKRKGRNYKPQPILLSDDYNTNEANLRINDFPKLINNGEINGKEILKNEINTKINDLMKNKDNNALTTKGKCVKEFYQNYLSSMSMSTGISLSPNNEIIYKENNFNLIKGNKAINSSNDNYEIDSTEEDCSHEIIFKGINNGSPITFGNSFSHTNTKRSSNSNNEEKDNNKEQMDKSILLLKSQNEILKKELKQSNQQITYLKNEIEKLMQKRKMNIINYKYNININNKKPEFKPKIICKNSSYLDIINNVVDKEHHYNNIRMNKNLSFNSCNSNKNTLKKNRKRKIDYKNQ